MQVRKYYITVSQRKTGSWLHSAPEAAHSQETVGRGNYMEDFQVQKTSQVEQTLHVTAAT